MKVTKALHDALQADQLAVHNPSTPWPDEYLPPSKSYEECANHAIPFADFYDDVFLLKALQLCERRYPDEIQELPFDVQEYEERCTRLSHFFTGVGANQEEARTEIRAQIAEAGGNSVVFVSGWYDSSSDVPESESHGENAVGYQCDRQ